MRQVFGAIAFLAAAAAATLASAEDAWVQIEARPTLAEAQERAQAYSGAFDNVQGYRLSSGWYGIVLGPFSPEEAARQLDLLKGERMIPADSFLATDNRLGSRFYETCDFDAGCLGTGPVDENSDVADQNYNSVDTWGGRIALGKQFTFIDNGRLQLTERVSVRRAKSDSSPTASAAGFIRRAPGSRQIFRRPRSIAPRAVSRRATVSPRRAGPAGTMFSAPFMNMINSRTTII